VLSLVLLQSRSYADIADLLRLRESEVRHRAHVAAAGLVAPSESLGEATRARIIDYLLGEQSVSERAETRAELGASTAARSWAVQLAAALAPLAKTALPGIPGEPVAASAAPEPAPVAPAAPAVRDPVAVAPPLRRPVQTEPTATGFPAPPAPSPTTRPWHGVRLPPSASRLIVPALVAAAAIVVLIVVLAGGGTASNHRHPGTIRKLVLRPAGSNRAALAAADLVRQKNGTVLLLLQARGLRPNRDNEYAVWLFNAPGDARLLGFVSPPVGRSGTFSSGVQLPDDAVRFHALIVTLEHSSQPATPGPTVLRAPLSLS
jgi:hypothetical protein